MCTICRRQTSGETAVSKRIETAMNALEMVRTAVAHAKTLDLAEKQWCGGEWKFSTKLTEITNFVSTYSLTIIAPDSHCTTLLRQVLGYQPGITNEIVVKLWAINTQT